MENARKAGLALLLSENGVKYCMCRAGKVVRTGRIVQGENMGTALRTAFAMPSDIDSSEICLLPDTDRVCLVPRTWFEREDAGRYLAVGGTNAAPSEELVVTEPVGDIVAAMYVGTEVWYRMRELFPGASVVHPLQVSAVWKRSARPAVEVFLTEKKAHLTVFADGRTLMARTVPCRNDADLLFYLNRIRNEYPRYVFRIGICGEGASEVRETAARYFPHVSLSRMPRRRCDADEDTVTEYLPLIRACHENC